MRAAAVNGSRKLSLFCCLPHWNVGFAADRAGEQRRHCGYEQHNREQKCAEDYYDLLPFQRLLFLPQKRHILEPCSGRDEISARAERFSLDCFGHFEKLCIF